MKTVTITRDAAGPDYTAGVMIADGEVFYTLERPWLENLSNVSCIPAGKYECEYIERSNNGKFKEVYRLKNVPDRAGVLIHAGNKVEDSHGCILIALGRSDDKKTIINSRLGLDKFRNLMGKENFLLEINGSQTLA